MSTPANPAALREMDLQLKGADDETVGYSKWGERMQLHTLARQSYQSDKPEEYGNWWRFSKEWGTPGTPICTLPIIIARLTPHIPIGGKKMNFCNYPYKTIDEEGFLMKERLAVWIKNG